VNESNRRISVLSLDDGTHRVIWDIGCGVPYFAAAAREYGHDARGIDYDETVLPISAQVLGVPYYRYLISVTAPLPAFIEKADMFTLFGVNLLKGDDWCVWADYEAFMHMLFDKLRPGGQVVLCPNRGELTGFVSDASRWNKWRPGVATMADDLMVVLTKH
jgi:hypothetical protein